MKKIIAVALCILLIAAPALAKTDLCYNDVAAMTDDELLGLKGWIQTEQFARGLFKETRVPAGQYTVGVDIPAGVYSITWATDYTMSFVEIYSDASAASDGLSAASYLVTNQSTIGKITLSDGQIVDLSGDVMFTPYTGLKF